MRDYFDRHAHEWVEAAYDADVRFPVGSERVRLAIEGVAPAMQEGSRLVDLGCGGGQLCIHAANLGWSAVGVDNAPGMIEESKANAGELAIEWHIAAYDESGLPAGQFDAVTAMGLIEYLPDDDGLFAEAARLLRPGGRFAVSCRNRLYNLLSVNDYTAQELDEEAPRLLEELRDHLARTRAGRPARARRVARRVGRTSSSARRRPTATCRRRSCTTTGARSSAAGGSTRRATSRRPRSGTASARRELLALHPHPLPPALEPLAPRTYNRLADAWQRALERSPAGLAFSTAFVAVFERA